MRDKIRDRLVEVQLEEEEALHKLGVVRGYAKALRDVLAEIDAERVTTECGSDEVETAARNPRAEKR